VAQLSVEAEAVTQAAPEAVWPLVADADRYSQWGPWQSSGYLSSGDVSNGDSAGVGAVRWMQLGHTRTVEQVLAVEGLRRLVYTVIKGIPVRNYRAEVTLTPAGEGTCIRWAATWDRTLGGRIVHRKLRAFYPEMMAQLVAAADHSVAASPETRRAS
jgi:uncharacterized protein YndB with AHSA1/START domain